MTTREDIRECVSVFSRGAPQLACQSSNTLLSCALPVITEKCGTIAAQFITDYVDRFAKAIDPSCKIIAKSNGYHRFSIFTVYFFDINNSRVYKLMPLFIFLCFEILKEILSDINICRLMILYE